MLRVSAKGSAAEVGNIPFHDSIVFPASALVFNINKKCLVLVVNDWGFPSPHRGDNPSLFFNRHRRSPIHCEEVVEACVIVGCQLLAKRVPVRYCQD